MTSNRQSASGGFTKGSKAPLKVALDMTFPNRNAGGSGVYARSLMGALQQTGDVSPIEVSAPEGGGTRGTIRWLATGAKSVLRGTDADLLHCPAYVVPWASPLPTVITLHDAATARFPRDYSLEWRLYNRFVLPRLARRASCLITPTEHARQDIARHYKLSPRLIHVTYEAAQPSYKPQPQGEVSRYRARLGAGVPLLLFVGAPVGRKNLDLVLDILANAPVSSHLSRATLLISGASAQGFPLYRDRIASLRLARRVRWLGHVPYEEMPLLYASADLLVFPSLYEGFGLPPLEAMAVGTPVVASSASCLPEVLGDAALLVDPTDKMGFAQAVESALARPELRSQLIEAGKTQAAKYSWERCARETVAAYRVALKAGRVMRKAAR